MGNKLPKRDRHGIYTRIEMNALLLLELGISATYEETRQKVNVLKDIRIRIEILKRLIRIMLERKIITEDSYIERELELQTMSKMAFGWLEWATKNSS